MAECILMKGGSGGTPSDELTATKAQVLTGYTAVTLDSNDEAVNGEMTNNGAVTKSLGIGEAFIIPKGFHNGSGKVLNGVANKGAVSASLNCGASYNIPQGYHDGNGSVSANSLSSQTSATASAAYIKKGYTAWINGTKVTGTMEVQSAINFSVVSVTAHSITIQWQNPSKGPFGGVRITGDLSYTGTGDNTAPGGWSKVTISNLTKERTYNFTCTSYCNPLGDGSSYSLSATTQSSKVYLFNGDFTISNSNFIVDTPVITDANKYVHILYSTTSSATSARNAYFTRGLTRTTVGMLDYDMTNEWTGGTIPVGDAGSIYVPCGSNNVVYAHIYQVYLDEE